MSFISRAIASTTRNFGKTAILLLIVFILGCVISGAISVQQAVQNTGTNIRATLPAIVTIELDHEEMNESFDRTGEWPEADTLTPELFKQFGELPYVRNYDFSVMAHLLSETLERYRPEQEDSMGIETRMMMEMSDHESFSLTGMQSTQPIDIEEGIIELIEGRMFTQLELDSFSLMALISEDLARINDLHVGATFTLEDILWDMSGEMEEVTFTEDNIFAQRSYDFEVIGIFRPLAEIDTGDEWMDAHMRSELLNRIYIPNPVALASFLWQMEQEMEMNPHEEFYEGKSPEDFLWYQNVYALYDSSDIPAFRAAVEDIAPEFFTVMDAGGNFAGIESSMESLSGLAQIILWIAVGASVLILSLLITLFLRERRREIGVYLALGEGRMKVVAQMMVEILAIALIAITVALFAGNLLAGGISETMLRNDLAGSEHDMSGMIVFGGVLDQMGIATEISTDEVLAHYSVSLNLTTITTFFIASIGTVVVATIMPMLYILRLNPRKIMM